MTLLATRPVDSRASVTRAGVPWSAVLLLAAVLAYADGFWLTSLRGAVGVVGRAQGPFTAWWRESTVVLPVFVLAVLLALMLSARWLGPVTRLRTTLATALLVTLLGSAVGVGELAVSSANDYRLQVAHLRDMASMGGECVGACLDRQQHATLAVHVHAVTYVSGWVLLTNAVLVAWAVALLGGRLRVRTVRRATARTHEHDLRMLAVATLAAAAAIHAAVVPEHVAEWPAAGVFFVVLTVGQCGVAGALLLRPCRSVLAAAALMSAASLAVWAWSRTAGLPFGPEPGTAEAFGVPDCLAAAVHAATLGAALVLLRDRPWLRRPRASAHAGAAVLVAVLAAATIGVAATGAVWPEVFASPGAAAEPAGSH